MFSSFFQKINRGGGIQGRKVSSMFLARIQVSHSLKRVYTFLGAAKLTIFASSLKNLCFRKNFFFRDVSVRVLRKV